MERTLSAKRRGHWLMWLAAAYIGLCAVRFGLARVSTLYPTAIPDEFLYYSMARSFGTGNGALMYGQKADFSYFLYPGVLSAVYALFGEGANFYRLLQLESILVMNSSIFPIFALARGLIRDERKAFLLSVLSLLMPDFILSARLLSESLLYPIFFLMLLAVWDGLESGRASDYWAVGALGGLLYGVKPGQVVTPIAAIALMAAFVFKKDRKRALAGICGGVLSLGAVCAALYCVNRFVVNPGTSALSIYAGQIGFGERMSLGAFLKSAALSPFILLLGGGVTLLALPLLQIRGYSPEKRRFFIILLVSAALIMLGTAWVVNRLEYNDRTIHARYFAMFFPAFLLLMNSDAERAEMRPPENDVYPTALLYALIGYAAICAAAFGYDGAISANPNNVAQYSLSLLTRIAIAHPGSALISALVVALVAGLGFLAAKGGRRRARIATALAAALIIANNCAAYTQMRSSVYPEIVDAGIDMREAAGGEDYVYVFAKSAGRYDAYLDVNTKKNVSMVYMSDLYNQMVASGGVYRPFVPGMLRGDIPDRETADAELILIDRDARPQLLLSDAATVVRENEYMTLVRVPRGERWLNGISGGMIARQLSAGTSAYFALFDEGSAYSTLKIDLELSGETKLRVYTERSDTYEFTLPEGRDSYNIGFPAGDLRICLCAPEADIIIHGFEFL